MTKTIAALAALTWMAGGPPFASAGSFWVGSVGTYISVPTVQAAGAKANAMPYAETFDAYPVDTPASGWTNGWSVLLGDASCVRPASDVSGNSGDASLFTGNLLDLETEGQTLSNVTTGQVQNVWIDMSVVMIPGEDLPPADHKSQQLLGLCVDASNVLCAYCGGPSNRIVSSEIQVGDLYSAPPKVRLTLQIAFADALPLPYFKVFLNQQALYWGEGYSLPGVASVNGGEWLPCESTNRCFCGVNFIGNGRVDNLRISNTYLGPDTAVQAGIEQAVAISWFSDYGRTYQIETCSDLSSNAWQPFGAPIIGTGKTNAVYEAIGSSPHKFYRVSPVQ